MQYEYSKTMKNLMRRKPSIIIHFAFVSIMFILIVCCVYGFIQDGKQIKQITENVQVFDPMKDDIKYSKLVPEYLSEVFASDDIESLYYYIALDQEQYPYLVAINANDEEQYNELIEYTYNDDVNRPSQITLYGIPIKIDDSLKVLAIDAFNVFTGENSIDLSNFDDIFGMYYLDTTQDLPTDDTFLTCVLLLIIFLIITYIILQTLTRKSVIYRKATLDKYNEYKLLEVDKELQDATTIYNKKHKVYFTKNYIINKAPGFGIVPFKEIVHVYALMYKRVLEGTRFAIVAETKDHVIHEIAIMKYESLFYEIVDKIQSILPDIEYGFEDGFITTAKSKFNVEVDTATSENGAESNILLGIIGSILCSTLGVVLWILIAQAGIIAGFAGYIIMVMSIYGYRKFSGYLDKKGQIIALFIAFLMIFCANYSTYAILYFFERNVGFLEVITNLPKYLTNANAWGNFTGELILGYFLSIVASYRVIRLIFLKSR